MFKSASLPVDDAANCLALGAVTSLTGRDKQSAAPPCHLAAVTRAQSDGRPPHIRHRVVPIKTTRDTSVAVSSRVRRSCPVGPHS